MNAREIIKIQSGFDAGAARVAFAAAGFHLAALVDAFVARWLERVATNAEAAHPLLSGKADPEAQI